MWGHVQYMFRKAPTKALTHTLTGQGAASSLGGGRRPAGRLDPSHPFMSPDVGQLITNLLLQLPFSRCVRHNAKRFAEALVANETRSEPAPRWEHGCAWPATALCVNRCGGGPHHVESMCESGFLGWGPIWSHACVPELTSLTPSAQVRLLFAVYVSDVQQRLHPIPMPHPYAHAGVPSLRQT